MLRKLSIILITCLLCNQVALAAVVVGSIPNSLSKKASYFDGKNIYLKKGQSLKVALCNNKRLTIIGPYDGKLK